MNGFRDCYRLQLYDKIKQEERNPRKKEVLEVGDFILVNTEVSSEKSHDKMVLAKIIDMFFNEHGEPCFRVITEEEECYDITAENQFKTIYLN